MTLFTLTNSDPDTPLTALTTTLIRLHLAAPPAPANCSGLLAPPTPAWFSLARLTASSHALQLTDLGYESLIHTATKTSHLQLANCNFTLQLTLQVDDTLFTNHHQLNLHIHFTPSPSQTRPAPVLATATTSEGFKPADEHLLNFQSVLVSYLTLPPRYQTANPADTAYLVGRELNHYKLLNYVDQFHLNASSLILLSADLDREKRDTYELFFGHATPANSLLPDVFRVLVKLADVNDNQPRFFEPVEAALSSLSPNDVAGVNRTVNWQGFVASNETNPLLTVRASDLDVDAAGRVEYELEGPEIVGLMLEIDAANGSIYLNRRLAANATLLDMIWQTYAPLGVAALEFSVVGGDFGTPRLESRLRVRLSVVFDVDAREMTSFGQTFYYFRIGEAIEVDAVFGYVDSARKEGPGQVVLRIVDGDVYNQFRVDYKTGALSAQADLDYANVSSYLLTVAAYDTFRPGQVVNASVRIDLEVRTCSLD